MPIEMPRGLPFSVDTWTPSSKKKRHHFLTHAHKDHTNGISVHSSYPIYCTRLTKNIVLQYYPQLDDSLFLGIEVGQSLNIDDPDGRFAVSAFDANHCPGAVMFLFEGNFGNVLHTGDCRLTHECLQHLPDKYVGKRAKEPRCQLDYIFLDCTFGKVPLQMPSKHSAIQQVINCIWRHPDAPVVYLTCDLLGQEKILVNVSQTFGTKIFVDEESNLECFQTLRLMVPEILSNDPSSRFQLLDGFPKLYERAEAIVAEAQNNLQPEPLIIRPSAQWYACDEGISETVKTRKERRNEAVRDQFGVWHVCYSMHSSREELEWALQLLSPKWVVSTTQGCWAMELDYVKRHCFNSKPAFNDPLWKLLDISMEASSTIDAAMETSSCSTDIKGMTEGCAEHHLQPKEVATLQKEFSNPLPPIKKQPVTLFGRARLGFQDSILLQKELDKISSDDKPANTLSSKMEQRVSFQQEHVAVKFGRVRLGFQDSTLPEKEQDMISSFDKPTITLSSKMEQRVLFKQENVGAKCGKSSNNNEGVSTETRSEELVNKKDDIIERVDVEAKRQKKDDICSPASFSLIGSSKCFSDNLRKLYRSMNVPVPKPLPSLVDLMKANKRTKRRFEF